MLSRSHLYALAAAMLSGAAVSSQIVDDMFKWPVEFLKGKAGTYVHACVYWPHAPIGFAMKVDFYADTQVNRDDACILRRGHNSSTVVTEAGVTCADLGWVEMNEVPGSWCGDRRPKWVLSYEAYPENGHIRYQGGYDHGTVSLMGGLPEFPHWNGMRKFTIGDYTPGTVLCKHPHLCNGKSIVHAMLKGEYKYYQSSEPIYIVFNSFYDEWRHNTTIDHESTALRPGVV